MRLQDTPGDAEIKDQMQDLRIETMANEEASPEKVYHDNPPQIE